MSVATSVVEADVYRPRVQLRDYQLEALSKMSGRDAFALLMAMRTGKTATLLADFGRLELAGGVEDLLVVAPKGVYRTWVGELEKHLDPRLYRRLRTEVYRSGRKSTPGFFTNVSGPRVLLMNIEAISSTKAARVACELFVTGRRVMIVVDESTVIKNYEAKRTKYMVRHLGPMGRVRRILSGLPTPRSPLDVYHQFEFLRPGILGYRNWWDFRFMHAVMRKFVFGGRTIDLVVGYRNIEELQRRVEQHSFRVEFRPDIPSTYSIREVEMTEQQRRLYRDLKDLATTKLDEESHVTATMVITQLLRLHQVLCGHVVDETGREHVIPENKTAELMELMEDYGGKAVVWCSYDHDVRKVAQALATEYDEGLYQGERRVRDPEWPNPAVARFWGGNVSSREEEERRFKEDPRCRFMVATPHAGGRGRTWDVADLVVYHSSTNNLEHRDQSEQRVQGVGKTRQVDYVDLICPGSVEDKILKALRQKIDLAGMITGDDFREWIV